MTETEFNPQRFRKTMSRFATGVAVLTAQHEGCRYGMTINSLTSVSMEPLQILVCLKSGSPTGRAVVDSGIFAVSLLDRDQTTEASSFVGYHARRFEAVECDEAHMGLPVIKNALASIVCRVEKVVTSGDHEVIFGEVLDCTDRDGEPLVFFGGSYGGFSVQESRAA